MENRMENGLNWLKEAEEKLCGQVRRKLPDPEVNTIDSFIETDVRHVLLCVARGLISYRPSRDYVFGVFRGLGILPPHSSDVAEVIRIMGEVERFLSKEKE